MKLDQIIALLQTIPTDIEVPPLPFTCSTDLIEFDKQLKCHNGKSAMVFLHFVWNDNKDYWTLCLQLFGTKFRSNKRIFFDGKIVSITLQRTVFRIASANSTNVANMVSKIMAYLMTDEVGIHMVWSLDIGKRNRPRFCKTEIAALVVGNSFIILQN